MRIRFGATALLLALVSSFACGPSQERTERDRVQSAIMRLDDVPMPDHEGKRRAALELLALPAETPVAQQARDHCGNGYLKLAESNLLTTGMQQKLSASASPAELAGLVGTLEQAEKLISESEALLEKCRVARGELALID